MSLNELLIGTPDSKPWCNIVCNYLDTNDILTGTVDANDIKTNTQTINSLTANQLVGTNADKKLVSTSVNVSNVVTTNTTQTITGAKTFASGSGTQFGSNTNNTDGIILNNNTTSYSPSVLNFYERAQLNLNFSGANTFTGGVVLSRIGNIVCCTIDAYTGVSNSTGIIAAVAQIPARFRPASLAQFVVSVLVNNAYTAGMMQVYSNGDLYITGNLAGANNSFTTGQNNGFQIISVSWST
jgi:hypothetical protein